MYRRILSHASESQSDRSARAFVPSSSLPLSLVTVDPDDAIQRQDEATPLGWVEPDNGLTLQVRRPSDPFPLATLRALAPDPAAEPCAASAGITLALHMTLTSEDGKPLAGVPICFWYEDRNGWRLPIEASPLDFAMFTHGLQISDERGCVHMTMPYPTAAVSGQGPVIFVRAYLPTGKVVHAHADGVLQLPTGQNPFYALTASADTTAARVPKRRFGAPMRLLHGLALDVATAQVQVSVGLKVRLPAQATRMTRKAIVPILSTEPSLPEEGNCE